MNELVLNGFKSELFKLAGIKDIIAIAKKEPSKLTELLSTAGKGKGSEVAKGLLYGTAGYGALTGLGYRNPETGKREPLHGASRKALKALLLAGLPAAALYRYPAMSRAAEKLVAKTPR